MKKLILSLIIGVFTAVSSFAEENITELPGWWWEQFPAICVPNTTLWEYADRNELQPLNVSYGKEGGQPDGVPVYTVTYWVGIETDETMGTVQAPNTNYSCILFRTFDVQLNPQFDFKLGPKL